MVDRVAIHLSDCRCRNCRAGRKRSARWTHGEWVIVVLAVLIISGWIVKALGR